MEIDLKRVLSYLYFCRDLATNKNISICLFKHHSENLNIYQVSFSTLFFLSRPTSWLPVVLNQCFSELWLLSVTPMLQCLGMLICNSGKLTGKWSKQKGSLGCIFKDSLKINHHYGKMNILLKAGLIFT